MQEHTWVAVLRRIPAAYHDGLILASSTGIDVIMQNVIRLEDELLIMRGRPAGTNDVGKIIVIPYFQITYITLPGKPSDAQVQAIFGDRDHAFATMPAVLPQVTPAPVPQSVAEEPTAVNGSAEENGQEKSQQLGPPSKSLLLAKLRAKLTGDSTKAARGK